MAVHTFFVRGRSAPQSFASSMSYTMIRVWPPLIDTDSSAPAQPTHIHLNRKLEPTHGTDAIFNRKIAPPLRVKLTRPTGVLALRLRTKSWVVDIAQTERPQRGNRLRDLIIPDEAHRPLDRRPTIRAGATTRSRDITPLARDNARITLAKEGIKTRGHSSATPGAASDFAKKNR